MPSTAANVRFNASRMHEHLLGGTSESGRSENSHAPSVGMTRPPLPRCIYRASQAREGDAKAPGYRDEPLARAAARRDASTNTAATALRLRSTSVKAQNSTQGDPGSRIAAARSTSSPWQRLNR